MGTAFLASPESDYTPNRKRRILEMNPSDTILTRVFDIALGLRFPEHIVGRAARNEFSDRWHGREDELKASLEEAGSAMQAAMVADDVRAKPVWAGMGVGLVSTTRSAGDIVRATAAEADLILRERSVPEQPA